MVGDLGDIYMSGDDYVSTGFGKVKNSINAGFADHRPSSSMPVGSSARLGAEHREAWNKTFAGSSSSGTPTYGASPNKTVIKAFLYMFGFAVAAIVAFFSYYNYQEKSEEARINGLRSAWKKGYDSAPFNVDMSNNAQTYNIFTYSPAYVMGAISRLAQGNPNCSVLKDMNETSASCVAERYTFNILKADHSLTLRYIAWNPTTELYNFADRFVKAFTGESQSRIINIGRVLDVSGNPSLGLSKCSIEYGVRKATAESTAILKKLGDKHPVTTQIIVFMRCMQGA